MALHIRKNRSLPLCAFAARSSFSIGGGTAEGRQTRNGRTNPFARNEMVATRLAWVLPRPAYGLGARRAAMRAFAGSEVVG